MDKKKAKKDTCHVIITENKDKFGNPAALGLAAFGMTTLLLNFHNAGFWPEFDSMILGTGLIFGGVAQMITGILDFFNNSSFGTVAFTAYGSFWISLCLIKILPNVTGVPSPTPIAMAFYLLIWGLFSVFMMIGTFKKRWISLIQIIFILLVLLFFILALQNIVLHFESEEAAKMIQMAAGIEGIILGLCALYHAGADVVNVQFGREVFPICIPVEKKQKD